jgi:hypothetical protein
LFGGKNNNQDCLLLSISFASKHSKDRKELLGDLSSGSSSNANENIIQKGVR